MYFILWVNKLVIFKLKKIPPLIGIPPLAGKILLFLPFSNTQVINKWWKEDIPLISADFNNNDTCKFIKCGDHKTKIKTKFWKSIFIKVIRIIKLLFSYNNFNIFWIYFSKMGIQLMMSTCLYLVNTQRR